MRFQENIARFKEDRKRAQIKRIAQAQADSRARSTAKRVDEMTKVNDMSVRDRVNVSKRADPFDDIIKSYTDNCNKLIADAEFQLAINTFTDQPKKKWYMLWR